MHSLPLPPVNTRLGFHYFPDALHYRESDLKTWLPELQALGASWLTLVAPAERAIPEFFLRGLLKTGTEPVLHFHLPLDLPGRSSPLRLLFHNYASWGVHYVALFDRPNLRTSWSSAAWAQADLVERFLDLYLPLAEIALDEGLIPLFPPLEPGGDYWDTSFLRAALHGMQRRGKNRLLDALVLSAYAWSGNRPLNWGAGGPERWPGARPYITPTGMQDQRGFRIFDWYLTLIQAELGKTRPILLLKAGNRSGDHTDPTLPAIYLAAHARRNLALVHLISTGWDGYEKVASQEQEARSSSSPEPLEPLPSDVLACNFWLLSASAGSPYAADAWFQPSGSSLPIVDELRRFVASRQAPFTPVEPKSIDSAPCATPSHPIAHYLLLPLYEWGVPDWHLDSIRPFVKQHHPTIGFSLSEAAMAARVTVVGGVQAFPEDVIETLQKAGCSVDRFVGDGTVIAP